MTPPLGECSDGALVAQALAGRQAAFAEIVRRHKAALHRLIARLIGDEEEALDLVQEAFVAAHGALGRYDPDRPMRAWLARIAINKARDWRRRRTVRRLIASVLPGEPPPDAADPAPTPGMVAADREELAHVLAAIDALPAKLREVLVLRTIEEMTQAEAALALGVTQKAVETRLYRARQQLAAAIARG